MNSSRHLNIRSLMLLPLAAAFVSTVLVGPKVHAADSVAQLPDLAQEPPRDVVISRKFERTRSHGRIVRRPVVRLAFTSQVDNIGNGPLLIDGARGNKRTLAMKATQTILNSDGSSTKLAGVGKWLYAVNPDHNHWHYQGFDTFTLKDRGGKKVSGSAKRGFCLGDRSKGFGWNQLGGTNAKYVDQCGLKKPNALKVFGGISPGWGDDYAAYLEGQSIVVSNLPAGNYCLQHEATHSFEEPNDLNNTAALIVKIDATAKQPTVTPLAASSIGDEGVADPSCERAFVASGLLPNP